MSMLQDLHEAHRARMRRLNPPPKPKPAMPPPPHEDVVAAPPKPRIWAFPTLTEMEPALPWRPAIGRIMGMVSRYYDVSEVDLYSARRARNIVRPRQVAMYLAKTLTTRSFPEIGRRVGDRDHTTVLHAVRKITALIATDPKIAKDVAALTEIIKS